MVSFPGLSGGFLGSLIVRIDADTRKLQTGLKQAEKQVDESGKKINVLANRIDAAVRVTKILGTVFFTVSALLVKSASDFESAFAGVRKTVDATEDEFFQLSEGLLNMSKRLPIAATQLARIQELAGQLGISGVQDLTDFTEIIAKIGTTTDLSIEAASIGLARFANLSGDSIENVDRLGSAIVGAGNKFKTFESNILELATRIAAAGRLAGLTSAEILGIATAFSEAGIQAEAGGTAIAKVLTELTADGRKGAEEFGKFIKEISDAGDTGAKKLEELGFGSDRLKRAFLSVAVQGDRFSTILRVLSKDYEENTALNIETAKRVETTASKTILLKNNIFALSVTLGEKLLPAFQNILISGNAVIDFFTELFNITRQAPESLNKDLVDRIKLLGQQIETQRAIIQTVLGDADIRQEAEQRINVLLEDRSRAILTLKDIEAERAAAIQEQTLLEAQQLEAAAKKEIKTTANKEKELLTKFKEFKKQIKTFDNQELKDKINKAELEELTFENLEEKKTEILKKEVKSRAEIEKKQKELKEKLFQQAGDTFNRVLRAQAENSRASAILLRVQSIGRAVINTAEGVTKALSTANIPLAIAIGAIGAAEVATIAGVQFQQGTDRVPAGGGFTHPEEIVIPQTFADAIRNGRLTLGGPSGAVDGGTAITNNFNFESVQLGDDIELTDFTERLGEDVAIKTRSVS